MSEHARPMSHQPDPFEALVTDLRRTIRVMQATEVGVTSTVVETAAAGAPLAQELGDIAAGFVQGYLMGRRFGMQVIDDCLRRAGQFSELAELRFEAREDFREEEP